MREHAHISTSFAVVIPKTYYLNQLVRIKAENIRNSLFNATFVIWSTIYRKNNSPLNEQLRVLKTMSTPNLKMLIYGVIGSLEQPTHQPSHPDHIKLTPRHRFPPPKHYITPLSQTLTTTSIFQKMKFALATLLLPHAVKGFELAGYTAASDVQQHANIDLGEY